MEEDAALSTQEGQPRTRTSYALDEDPAVLRKLFTDLRKDDSP